MDDGSVTSGAGVEIIATANNRSQSLSNGVTSTTTSGSRSGGLLRIQDDAFNDAIDDELSSRDRDEDEECHTSTSNQAVKPKTSFFGFDVSSSGCYNCKVLGSVMILGLLFILMSTGISGVVKNCRNRIASTDGSKLLFQARGSKSNKNDDSEDLCPVDGINLPLSDTCDVEQGVTTTMIMTYEYILTVNDEDQDEDDTDHIISCKEVTLHQSLLGNFCPSTLRAKSQKKKKKGEGEDEGSIGIVASISSSPNDLSVDTTCPVTIQLEENESCLAITGGLTLELQFASSIERRRLGYGTGNSKENDGMSSSSGSGSEWIKDGAMSRGLQELTSYREALKNMLVAVMTAMNENLGTALQPDDAIAFVDNLSDDFLQQLMNGELNLDANVSDGNFVVDTVGPPSSEPSTSTSPSISLQPSASLQPSSCGCVGPDACEGNTGEFVLRRYSETVL